VRAGETITAADGYGRWRVFTVATSERGRVELQAVSPLAHEPLLLPRLTVACSLTKGEKPELVVQKLTELGADRVLLVEAARSVVRWDDTKAAAVVDRLQRVAREAGAQSRRARVPVVEGPIRVAELAGLPGLVVAAVDGGDAASLPTPRQGEWVVAIGPEGGFAPDELTAMGRAPRLGLGPFVLRAETAAIAACAALHARRTFSTSP
jgi:16S rRNA (uracil1498-N3)-methyltransferase